MGSGRGAEVGRGRARDASRRGLLRFEQEFWARGLTRVGGVDEVGVGPLAGPLVAAAVILPREVCVEGVDDSKKLDPKTRLLLAERISAVALGVGLGVVEVEEVDRLDVLRGAVEAMRRAVKSLPEPPEQLLVDARSIPGIDLPQRAIVKGDTLSQSIAAASILAKVARDAMMDEIDRRYPGYGFSRHKGYGTPEHLAALDRLGPCPAHRMSFACVRQPRLPGL